MERPAPPAPPIKFAPRVPAPRVSLPMPAVDAELNRDVFSPTWSDGGASVQRLDGTTGGEEYVRRPNYIPQEQQTLNSIPTSEEKVRRLMEQLRSMDRQGVEVWPPVEGPSVSLINENIPKPYGPESR